MVAVNFENIFVNRFVDEFFRMLDLEMKREDKNDWMMKVDDENKEILDRFFEEY